MFFVLFIVCLNAFFIDFRAWALLKMDAPARSVAAVPPRVSVLVAVRNEEKNVAPCLDALLNQNYPTEKIEILIADDQSEDLSYRIASNYSKQHPNISLFRIDKLEQGLNGKANALARLAQSARGEYLLITDADVVVPPTWIGGMVSSVRENTGIVNGITLVKARFLFGLFQSFDWTRSLSYIQVLGGKKVPVTAMGNNMLITKEAYDSVGGFEATKGSITEDFSIFRKIVDAGYGYRTYFNETVLAFTKAQTGFGALLVQRKRWMKGAMKLPALLVVMLFLQALFAPAIVGIFFYSKMMAIALFGLKVSMQSILLLKAHELLKLRPRFILYVFYEFYNIILTMCLMIFYFVPLKLRWKGRKY